MIISSSVVAKSKNWAVAAGTTIPNQETYGMPAEDLGRWPSCGPQPDAQLVCNRFRKNCVVRTGVHKTQIGVPAGRPKNDDRHLGSQDQYVVAAVGRFRNEHLIRKNHRAPVGPI